VSCVSLELCLELESCVPRSSLLRFAVSGKRACSEFNENFIRKCSTKLICTCVPNILSWGISSGKRALSPAEILQRRAKNRIFAPSAKMEKGNNPNIPLLAYQPLLYYNFTLLFIR
jgi:hypothetical protein